MTEESTEGRTEEQGMINNKIARVMSIGRIWKVLRHMFQNIKFRMNTQVFIIDDRKYIQFILVLRKNRIFLRNLWKDFQHDGTELEEAPEIISSKNLHADIYELFPSLRKFADRITY